MKLAAILGIVAALAAGAGGCGRPLGDFGRAEPSVVHDGLMPKLGGVLAKRRKEPVSDYRLTDLERRLRDRSWHLVSPPHVKDWFNASKIEFQRTRLAAELDHKLDRAAYYHYLRKTHYRSSDTRYRRLIEDMRADEALIYPFARMALRVRHVDKERKRVLRSRSGVDPEDVKDTLSRIDENRRRIAWVKRAMRYRLASYRHAIDKLELETPSDLLYDANRAWDRLAWSAKNAWRTPGRDRLVAAGGPKRSRYSRYSSWGSSDDRVPQK